MLLTDEEITLIVRECARGSAINRDGSTSHRIARAIEAAVLAKLREQEPVVFYDGNKFYANEESAICGCADMAKLKPVFTHPAPIPEGWKELMIRTISRMRAAHVPCADIERSAEAMLAAAKSE